MKIRVTRRLKLLVAVASFAYLGPSALNASPITWQLVDVTFHPASGPGGPITASGTLTYDADIQTMLSWNIVVSGAADPTVNFTFTPASSFIPSIYTNLGNVGVSVRFVRSLPGNPTENPFGTDPFDSNSVLIDLDFFSSPGNLGLINGGGTINIVNGGSQIVQIFTNDRYAITTGCVEAGAVETPCVGPPVNQVPEPASTILTGEGLAILIWIFRLRRRSMVSLLDGDRGTESLQW